MHPTQSSAVGRGVRIVGLVLTIVVGVPFVLLVWVALSSRFGLDSRDLHGYALIFGTFLSLIFGFVLALIVPMMFRPGRRATAYIGTLTAYAVVAVGMILLLITA